MHIPTAFSPCPNDTFLFYALVHGKISSSRTYTPTYLDIEELNQSLLQKKFPLMKCSVATALTRKEQYHLLPVGTTVGFTTGPLLVGKEGSRVAIPGEHTMANFLYRQFCSKSATPIYMRYDQILPALKKGEIDQGVLIHESRFVYQEFGFELLQDLGKAWEEATQLPVPLGCLVIDKNYPHKEVEEDLLQSLKYAKDHKEEVIPYLKEHAQELDLSIIEKHLDLFVNEDTERLSHLASLAIEEVEKRQGASL